MIYVIPWLFFCIIVGVIASKRKLGFFGGFILSLILSPLIGFIFAILSPNLADIEFKEKMLAQMQQQNQTPPPSGEKKYKCKACGYQSDEYSPFCPQCGAH